MQPVQGQLSSFNVCQKILVIAGKPGMVARWRHTAIKKLSQEVFSLADINRLGRRVVQVALPHRLISTFEICGKTPAVE
jgi:hypothetical protein